MARRFASFVSFFKKKMFQMKQKIIEIFRVEDEHFGQDVNTVMYIPAGPECPLNRLYVERAKNCFENGLSPPDFHMNRKANMEKDFKDRATVEDLNEDALVMMGFKSM